ncbi:MAG TPA: hypothetical protein VEY30_03025 [Myxococcaceae bacterium]|nr:hypothetical protein [Myxococcaceae bacterium]
MRARAWLGVTLAAVACARVSDGRAPEGMRALWVDPQAAEVGEGSREHPFRDIRDALAVSGPKRVYLAAGTYRGGFELSPATELWGEGRAAVFVGTSSAATLMVASSAVLRGLTLRGEGTVVELRGGVTVLEDCRLETQSAESKGLRVAPGTTALLKAVEFSGPFRRAIEVVSGASLEASGTRFAGTGTAVHLVGGRAVLRRTEIGAGAKAGPGVFCATGALRLEQVSVQGHEYGLLTRAQCQLEGIKLTVSGAWRAGVSLVETRGQLTELSVADSGSYGGVQLVGSNMRLERFQVQRSEAYGISARGGRLLLLDGEVALVRDHGGSAGDGIHARAGRVEVRSVTVRSVEGVGLLAAQQAQVTGRGLVLQATRAAGLLAETGARVSLSDTALDRTQGPALVVPGDAQVRLDSVEASGPVGAGLFIDCARGARVEVSDWRGESYGLALPCVRRSEKVPTPLGADGGR